MGYRNIDAPWHFLMRNDVQLVKKNNDVRPLRMATVDGFYYGEPFFHKWL